MSTLHLHVIPLGTCIFLMHLYANGSMITGPFEILTHNITITADPAYFEMQTTLHRDRYPVEIDAMFHILRDLNETILIQGNISTFRSYNNKLQPLIVGRSLEICRFFAKPSRDLFLSIYFRILHDYGNRLESCPIRAMQFNITGLQFKSKYLPSFVPAGEYMAQVDFWSQQNGGQSRKEMMRWLWFGELRRS